jgi:hypothetical protein
MAKLSSHRSTGRLTGECRLGFQNFSSWLESTLERARRQKIAVVSRPRPQCGIVALKSCEVSLRGHSSAKLSSVGYAVDGRLHSRFQDDPKIGWRICGHMAMITP